jgi:hypothetical protein
VYQRNYDGDRQIRDEIVPGCEWVLGGEGRATRKYDGTSCMVKGNQLYKRYDRKLTKQAKSMLKNQEDYEVQLTDFKPAPEFWIPCEKYPDPKSHHWPGWVPVRPDDPSDQYHIEALEEDDLPPEGTYELIGPKVQGNPEGIGFHVLIRHGARVLPDFPRDFDAIRDRLIELNIEGVVFWNDDGRMAKVKLKDFGLERKPEGVNV